MLGSTFPPPTEPSVTSVTVALTSAGACNSGGGISVSANVRATWALANSDYTAHTVKVYRGTATSNPSNPGTLKLTLTSPGTTTYNQTAPGVESDDRHPTAVSWTFTVAVIRNSDMTQISGVTSAVYSDSFGNCVGPA